MTANIICLYSLDMMLFRAAIIYKNKFKITNSTAQFAIDMVRKKGDTKTETQILTQILYKNMV